MSKGGGGFGNWKDIAQAWLTGGTSAWAKQGSAGDKIEAVFTMGAIDRAKQTDFENEERQTQVIQNKTQLDLTNAAKAIAIAKRKADAGSSVIDNRSRIIAEQYAKKKTLTGGTSTLGHKSILGE